MNYCCDMKVFATTSLFESARDRAGAATQRVIEAEVVWIENQRGWDFVDKWERSDQQKASRQMKDMIEYCNLAAKRWTYIQQHRMTVTSMREMRERIEHEPESELGLALAILINRHGKRQVLGFGFLRRTWLNHLVLEFLSISPSTFGNVKAIGSTLMCAIARIGFEIGATELWGECTKDSQGFYTRLKSNYQQAKMSDVMIQGPEQIEDHFHFGFKELEHLAAIADLNFQD